MTDIAPDNDPQADPEETALLQELEGIFETRAQEDPVEEPAEEEEETPTEEPAPEGEPEVEETPEPETQPSGLTDQELDQLRGIRDALANDPVLRQRIIEHYQGQQAPAAPVTTPAQPSSPELPELDLDDPAIAAVAARLEAQQRELAQLRANQALQQTSWEAQRQADAAAQYTTASEQFRREHSLEPSDIEHLSQVAARLGVLPQLLQGTDPFTGLPVRPDPIYAVERALEIAYFNDPKYREHEQRRLAESRHKENTRKQRLAAVDGKSGSAPRKPAPAPEGADAKRQAMIQEVADAMFGGNN